MKTCAIIPACNEARTIGKVVQNTRNYVDAVFVIDDGSNDSTFEIARQNGAQIIQNESNKGMGYSLRRGYEAAINQSFDIVIQLDGDGQHNPKYIPEMLKAIEDCDMVIGSRFLNHSYHKYPFVRRIGIRFFTFTVNVLVHMKISDVTSGYRVFRTQTLKQLPPLRDRNWAIAETLEAGMRGLKVKEVSVEMPIREVGQSQFNLKSYMLYPLKMSWVILKFILSGKQGIKPKTKRQLGLE